MHRWLALCLLPVLVGCLGGTFQPDVFYALEPNPTVTPGPSAGKTLGIRGIESSVLLRRPMVYRDTAFRLQTYDGALWADEPARIVTRELAAALRASGRFDDVASATSLTTPDLVLTGAVERFEEVRSAEGRTAVCAVRIDVRTRTGRDLVYGERLEAVVALADDTLEAYAAAMTAALEQVIAEAAAGIAGAVAP